MAEPTEFGAEMRRLRDERGFSLKGLAEEVCYTKGYLSNIENGRKRPSLDLARRIDAKLQADGALLALLDPTAVAGRPHGCPYRGMESYGAEDADRFFGRERVTATLVNRLARAGPRQPLVLFGASGSGKSSLLRAGLLPAIARGALPMAGSASWPTLTVTPTASPVTTLVDAVAKRFGGSPDDLRHGFGDALRGMLGDPTERLVLLVDQFEELFTLCDDDAEKATYVSMVCQAACDGIALVVLGVRADFYAQCLTFPELAEAVQSHQFAVAAMTVPELTEVITRPAQAGGLSLESGLVDVLLRDLGAYDEGAHDPGVLPLLSHALLATWQQRDKSTLTVAGYQLTGGIRGAVAATAERVYSGLDPAAQEVARQVLLRLVRVAEEGQDTRRRLERSRLLAHAADPEATNRVLAAFADARLVTLDHETVEFTHEAVLRAWPRLRGWIDTDRVGLRVHQRLAEAAEAWHAGGQGEVMLYRGAELAVATDWAQRHRRTLSATERQFLTASGREQQRGVRRLRRLVAALTVLSVLAAAAIVVATWQGRQAARERDAAVSQKVGEQARTLRATNPALAAQLALAAYQRAETVEARGAVLGTVAPYVTRYRAGSSAMTASALSPDGALLAAAGEDGIVYLWDARDPRRPDPLGTHPAGGEVLHLAFLPRAGRPILLVATPSSAGLLDVSAPSRPVPLGQPIDHPRGLSTAAVSPAGDQLATTSGTGADKDRVIQLWNIADPTRPALGRELPRRVGVGTVMTFGPGGDTLVTGTGAGALLWDLRRGGDPRPIPGVSGSPTAVAVAPDGRHLAWSNSRRDTWLVPLDRAGAPGPPRPVAVKSIVNGLAFSPDGTILITGGDDRKVRLWDVATGTDIHELPHPGRVLSLTVPPGAGAVVAGGTHGEVDLWHQPLATLAGHTGYWIDTFVASPDRRLAVTAGGPTAKLWDIGDPRRPVPLSTFPPEHGAEASINAASVDASNQLAATVGYGHDVVLWSIRDRLHPTRLWHEKIHNANMAMLSPDGKLLVTSANGAQNTLVWDLAVRDAPRQLTPLGPEGVGVRVIAFHPRRPLMVTGGTDGAIRLWDMSAPTAPRQVGRPGAHTESVSSLRFSPDGGTLASTSYDWTARLWSVTGDGLAARGEALRGHTDQVHSADFSPDGRFLVTTGADYPHRLWDVSGEKPVPYAVVALPKSGTALFTGETGAPTLLSLGGQALRYWTTDPRTAGAAICSHAGAPVTEDEWERSFGEAAYDPPC